MKRPYWRGMSEGECEFWRHSGLPKYTHPSQPPMVSLSIFILSLPPCLFLVVCVGPCLNRSLSPPWWLKALSWSGVTLWAEKQKEAVASASTTCTTPTTRPESRELRQETLYDKSRAEFSTALMALPGTPLGQRFRAMGDRLPVQPPFPSQGMSAGNLDRKVYVCVAFLCWRIFLQTSKTILLRLSPKQSQKESFLGVPENTRKSRKIPKIPKAFQPEFGAYRGLARVLKSPSERRRKTWKRALLLSAPNPGMHQTLVQKRSEKLDFFLYFLIFSRTFGDFLADRQNREGPKGSPQKGYPWSGRILEISLRNYCIICPKIGEIWPFHGYPFCGYPFWSSSTKRLFLRLFWDFRPGGPADSCKWALGSQCQCTMLVHSGVHQM